jgi:hypothetical protein
MRIRQQSICKDTTAKWPSSRDMWPCRPMVASTRMLAYPELRYGLPVANRPTLMEVGKRWKGARIRNAIRGVMSTSLLNTLTNATLRLSLNMDALLLLAARCTRHDGMVTAYGCLALLDESPQGTHRNVPGMRVRGGCTSLGSRLVHHRIHVLQHRTQNNKHLSTLTWNTRV